MRLTSKICLILLLLFFGGSKLLLSQTSIEASNIVITADKCNSGTGEVASCYKLYEKAVRLELSMPHPDSAFIGNCYIKVGNLLKKEQKLRQAVDNYKTAAAYLKPYSLKMSQVAINIAAVYEMAYKKGTPLAPVKEQQKTESECFFKVTRIISHTGDTVKLEIKGGTRDGLYDGSTFNVFSSYNQDDTRGNEFLGSGTIKQTNEFSSIGLVKLHDTSSIEKMIIEGDNVNAMTRIKTDPQNDLFYKMAIYNIDLLDNMRDPLFTQWQILQNDEPGLKEILYNATIYILRDVAEFTTEYKDIYSTGVYQGMNCTQAITVTEPCDVDEFLNFIQTYPAKYIGLDWKYSEVHVTWIILSVYEGNPYPPFVSWLEEKKVTGQLEDFIANRPGYFTTSRMLEYFDVWKNRPDKGLNDSTFRLIDILLGISEKLGNDSLCAVFHEEKAYVLHIAGKLQEAIEEYSLCLSYNPDSYNSLYYRAIINGQLNDLANAIKDYKTLTEKLPEYAGGWGGLGWNLILQGRLFEAQKACQKAYELDSMSVSWTVNLGHIQLFLEDIQQSYYFYLRSLKMLTTTSEFQDGLIADFDIFLENNWKPRQVNAAKDFIVEQYKLHYQNYLTVDELFNAGIAQKDSGNYQVLIDKMKLSLNMELQSDSVRYRVVHHIYGWIGYGYQFLERYDSAYYYYNMGLSIAENELKSDDNIQNDLGLLRWLCETTGNTIKSEAYQVELRAQKQKAEEKIKKKNLFLISVGIDAGEKGSYTYAASDAESIAESILNNAQEGYDSVFVVILKNEKASREAIQLEFEKIVARSNPYDLFVFYFAGHCTKNGDNNYLTTAGYTTKISSSESLKNSISSFSLFTMLEGIPARKKWLIFDAGAQGFVSSLMSIELSKNASLDDQQKSLFILCPSETRIERTEIEHGLLTHTIMAGLQGGAENTSTPDGMITVKEMDSYIFQIMSNEARYLNFSSYSRGRDFPISFLSNFTKNYKTVLPIATQTTRGATLIQDEATQQNASNTDRTDYALVFACDNFDEWQDLKNPVFDAKTLAGILEKEYGFKVELVTDATRRMIQDKILAYKKKEYNPGDQLLIFFAGHGFYDEMNMQEGYIVAKDSKQDDPYKDSYVSFSFLRDQTEGNCQHILLVLDVCFGGTFSGRLNPMSRGNNDIYSRSNASEMRQKSIDFKSRYYITSGNKEYVADGIPGKHSPFASLLIDGLMQGAYSNLNYLTYNDLITFIDQIKTSTPTHSSYGESEPGGNFIFEVNREQNPGSFKVNNSKP